jgi:hypothetical protein
MANPEHIDLVKQGVLEIRRWRDANPNELLDLREADLAGVKIELMIPIPGKITLGPLTSEGLFWLRLT